MHGFLAGGKASADHNANKGHGDGYCAFKHKVWGVSLSHTRREGKSALIILQAVLFMCEAFAAMVAQDRFDVRFITCAL